MSRPKIIIVGAGAAGLWCALRLVERGFPGANLSLIEPSPKDQDDRTWSYWTHRDLLPASLVSASFEHIELAVEGARESFATAPYRYESLRSSAFYAYAKTRLAHAGVEWVAGRAEELEERPDGVTVLGATNDGGKFAIDAHYVLDSRMGSPRGALEADPSVTTLIQPFLGWYVESDTPCFDPGLMTFMDFVDGGDAVCFYYVIPQSSTRALVEIALFGQESWPQERFEASLAGYLRERYGLRQAKTPTVSASGFGESPGMDEVLERSTRSSAAVSSAEARTPATGHYHILEREAGTIPMTDRALWRDSTARIWKIGTAAGWVQPASGYAFTRIARFADEVAVSLQQAQPRPWSPEPIQQIFQSVMLGHLRDHPRQAGPTFLRLFRGAGAATTFAFLDERATWLETIRVMNASPRLDFIARTLTELGRRLRGGK